MIGRAGFLPLPSTHTGGQILPVFVDSSRCADVADYNLLPTSRSSRVPPPKCKPPLVSVWRAVWSAAQCFRQRLHEFTDRRDLAVLRNELEVRGADREHPGIP